ncbi:DNA adenine methylase [Patescibacteria group bacterium]|nr:DNA adenine methylase [Patescibacteria group bacterium]
MRYSTPLRYPGGKSKLANFIKLIFKENNLIDGHYVEPYAGGAGIAFSLLFQEYVSHIHINDLNMSVYAFWHSVLNKPEDLCKLIHDTPVTLETWRQQKRIQQRKNESSLLELGFSTFFLNRTNRSGIITGGAIGGIEQKGKWKIDARYNKETLIERVKKIAIYSNRIKLYNLDASIFISDILPKIPQQTLIYLDPPYYEKGKGLYQNHYKHDDHAAVSKLITSQIKQKWLVSYDNTPQIQQLYKDYRQIQYGLSYSANEHYEGSEIIFFCDDLIVPPITNPAKTKAA